MGGPSNFFVVPTVELLAVETARISTGLTNPTAENQRVDELKLECTKCWAEPRFFRLPDTSTNQSTECNDAFT